MPPMSDRDTHARPIDVVADADATGSVRTLYDRIRGPDGSIDNIMMAHSLRPHTMEGHMALYKATLHHAHNTLPRWWLETLGVYVSALNGCSYCVDHHFAGLTRILADDARAAAIWTALDEERFDDVFDAREVAALAYAKRLTDDPAGTTVSDLAPLRAAGWSDGEILETNQVVAYFAYANRTVMGLGVTTEGDTLGLAPTATDDPNDWGHR